MRNVFILACALLIADEALLEKTPEYSVLFAISRHQP